MVALDDRAALDRAGLNHVGVNRALREEFHALETVGLIGKAVDEFAANQLALGLRVGNARELGKEALLRIHDDQIHRELLGEHLAHGFRLVLAHKAVVDIHARQPLADGAGNQRRGDGGIHAAGKTQQHLALGANLRADGGDGLVDEGAHRPVAHAAADIVQEVGQHALALLAVRHLGVELHGIDALFGVGHRAEGAVFAVRDGFEALRRVRHMVGVAHPRDGLGLHAREQGAFHVKAYRHAAVLALCRALHRAAEGVGGNLHPIADAQHRNAQLVNPGIDARRVLVEHGRRAAGENHAHRLLRAQLVERSRIGNHLAEDLRLAHAAGDKLGILRAKVHNDDALYVLHGCPPSKSGFAHCGDAARRAESCALLQRPAVQRSIDTELLYTVSLMKSRRRGKKFDIS